MHKWLMGLLLAILFAFGAVSTGCVDVGEDDGDDAPIIDVDTDDDGEEYDD